VSGHAQADPSSSPENPATGGAEPDDSLIARIRAGETACFEVLMRRHNGRLYRAIRSILRDEAQTEDVMQESYVRAYAGLKDFAGRSQFSTWLIQIGVNEAIARSRHARLSPVQNDDLDMLDVPAKTHDPERQVSAQQLMGLLEKAVDDLPPGYREVFVLRQVEGLSVAETAESLSLSEEAVKTRAFRAHERLRSQLEGWLDGTAKELFSFHAPRCNRVVANVFARLKQ
jgi:RNA polymerase sigma-70 factor (ECF subfamily)